MYIKKICSSMIVITILFAFALDGIKNNVYAIGKVKSASKNTIVNTLKSFEPIIKNINKLLEKKLENKPYEIYVGSGKLGYKDGNHNEAEFLFPYGINFDKEGNLLVVDSQNNRIRKIANNTVTTLAGYSNKLDEFKFPLGEYVDDFQEKAKFNNPRDIVLDNEGNIYISDSGNNCIRKIVDGKVYTFVGTGKMGYKDGNKLEAEFNLPTGIALDNENNLYIADTLNNVIRKISNKGDVSTFAGIRSENGGYKDGKLDKAMFNEPSDIVIDKNGIMYVADSGNQRIRKIEKDEVTTFAGSGIQKEEGTEYVQAGFIDGKALESKFNFPKGICIDELGNLYVADTYNHSIRMIDSNRIVHTIAGDGIAGIREEVTKKTRFEEPVAIVYKDGYLYVSDNKNSLIGRIKMK